MSDILIKNVKMPDKATTIIVFPEGKARVFRQDIDHDEWLTAIEVPQHGKLIDADALDICKREQQAWQDYEHNPDNEYLEGVKDGLHEASKQLSTAMTIIEAEEDK